MSVAVSSFFPNAPPSAPRNVAIRAAPAAALPQMLLPLSSSHGRCP